MSGSRSRKMGHPRSARVLRRVSRQAPRELGLSVREWGYGMEGGRPGLPPRSARVLRRASHQTPQELGLSVREWGYNSTEEGRHPELSAYSSHTVLIVIY